MSNALFCLSTGMASWQCGTNGQWRGKPDLSNCISTWMEDIKEVVRYEPRHEKTGVLPMRKQRRRLASQ